MSDSKDPQAPTEAPGEGFFDRALLSELEADLAAGWGTRGAPAAVAALPELLAGFLARPEELAGEGPLDEGEFVALAGPTLAERTNRLVETCRAAGTGEAAQAVESFVVFFSALVPTLGEEGGSSVKRVFFHLVPVLLQVAYADFGSDPEARRDGRAALRSLEQVLLELSSVRLTPQEGELVFRAIDQMAAFIASGEYALAGELVSRQLLGLIARNRLARALYRLMEVEVSLQRYLRERLGYATPQLRLPGDARRLAEYGPLRVFEETFLDGVARRLIQVHVPNVPSLRDVVLHLVDTATRRDYALRLDRIGSAELEVPDGTYSLGLTYEPQGHRT